MGYLSSYLIQPDGGLSHLCTAPTLGRGNTAVAFDSTGTFALVTRYWEGSVCVLPFSEDGMIGSVCSEASLCHALPH